MWWHHKVPLSKNTTGYSISCPIIKYQLIIKASLWVLCIWFNIEKIAVHEKNMYNVIFYNVNLLSMCHTLEEKTTMIVICLWLCSNGISVLHCAVGNSHHDIVEMLLRAKARINVRGIKSGRTPLFVAAEVGDMQMLDMLIKAGARVNIRNDYGQWNSTNLVSWLTLW